MRRALQRAAFLSVLLIGLVEEHRGMLLSRGEAVPGGLRDTRLGVFLLEHWNRSLAGDHHWLSPPIFYPESNSLGYTDSFFLFAPAFIVARRLGAGIYASYEVSLLTASIIAFASMVLLLRRFAGVSPLLSLVGGFAFAFANNLYEVHFQLHAVAFVPLVAVLFMEYLRRRQLSLWPALWFGVAAVALMDLVLFTAFHIGWFSGFLIAATGVIAMCFGVAAGWRPWIAIPSRFKLRLHELGILVAAGVVAGIPVLLTYGPTYREVGGHNYLPELLPTPVDGINVGRWNAVWGPLLTPLWTIMEARPESAALQTGVPLGLAIVFLIVVALVGRRLVQGRQVGKARESSASDLTTCILGAGVMAAWLVTLRVGSLSAWPIVRRLVPGANAIRGVVRIHHVLAVPMVVVTFMGLQKWLEQIQRIDSFRRRRIATVGYAALLALLVAETVRLDPRDAFSKAAETAYLADFAAPPPECRSFYGRLSPGTSRPTLARSVDAALIGVALGIPTINGPTEKRPLGWDLSQMAHRTYEARVTRWIAAHDLKGVCPLNLDTGEWGLPNSGR